MAARTEVRLRDFLTHPVLASRYRIVDRIGAGGMGEVYRAHDAVLDRDVALKVLPPELAGDPERLSRFQREARATAALNHPNILAIHDFGTDAETTFAVTELLDGETLRERLARGRLDVKQSLAVAIAVARGLAAAHGKGIVHRDLKPANLFLTREGVVKILDFGIAKLVHPEPAGQAQTLTELTAEGSIIGTLGYMAPEQVRGAAVDQRADIFALGCVLYEMLSRLRPFARATAAETANAVLNDEAPPLDAGGRAVPPVLARIVECCLVKRPEDRLGSAHDLALALEAVSSATGPPAAAPARRPAWWMRAALPWGVAALAILAVVVVSPRLQRRRGQPLEKPRRLAFTLTPGILTRAIPGQTNPALSPDGTSVAYISRRGGGEQLYLRSLARANSTLVPGTANATSPFFSPDGQWLGFFADGKLKKVPLAGGPPVTICAAPRGACASWGVDGSIVFAPAQDAPLWRVSAAGGAPAALTRLDEARGERSHSWPELLPAGDAVVFAVATDSGSRIDALRLPAGARTTVVANGGGPVFYAVGHLVYLGADGVVAAPFDPARLTVTGPAVTIGEPAPQLAVSRDGLMAYAAGLPPADDLALVWADRNGVAKPLTDTRRSYFTPRLSPDGKRLAVGIRSGSLASDIWILDVERDVLTRLTFDEASSFPIWTPDGTRVAFSSRRGSATNLFWKPADGSGPEEALSSEKHAQFPHSFSPDGRLLAFDNSLPGDVWLLPIGDPARAVPLVATPFREWGPRFSPDGRWLAYLSDESGRLQLCVRRYPESGGSWQLSTDGATEPVWAGNGEIFFRADDRLMVVAVQTEPTFAASRPRTLFEVRYETGLPGISNYDVTPDGQRFVMVRGAEQETASTQLTVVVDWFLDVKPS